MKQKAFFITFKGLLMKQINFLEKWEFDFKSSTKMIVLNSEKAITYQIL